MYSVSFNFEPTQFLASWREKNGTLFLPTLSESRVGDEVAVRVGIYGRPIRATLFGKVGLVRRFGRPALPPGVEIQLERHSLAAAGFLAMAARGEPVTFRERAPRWSVQRTLRVTHGGAAIEATTVNVSEGGCAVRWPAQLPLVGDEVLVRLRGGWFARSVRAIVCWSRFGENGDKTVGLKVLAAGRAFRSWRDLVDDVARSGAPSA